MSHTVSGAIATLGLAAFGLGAPQAQAHSYQDCYEFHVQSCLMVTEDDPIGNCQAQANAFCSNHSHGGGGFEPLDLDFTIEDDEEFLTVTRRIAVKGLSKDQRQYLKTLMSSRHEMLMLRLKVIAAEAELQRSESTR